MRVGTRRQAIGLDATRLGKILFTGANPPKAVEHKHLRHCRFEAKGTTGTAGGLSGALADGKLQTAGITATDPISLRAVVGCALGGGTQPATVVILDPPGPSTPLGDHDAEPTNLTADLVHRAAKQMRTPSAFGISPVHGGEKEGVTLFRGPRDATGATREIKLTNEFKEDKGHGWLENCRKPNRN